MNFGKEAEAFIEDSSDMQHVYKNTEHYNPEKKLSTNSFWWYDCWYD